MALTKFPIDYIKIAKDREKRTLAMTSVHEIAFGISPLDKRKYKRNRHLWCYNTKALQAVELWLNSLNVIGNPNLSSFADLEKLYDFVLGQIVHIPGISFVEVYDVSLYLGECMMPQIVPSEYVYVHGKLVQDARHYLKISKMKKPICRIKSTDFVQLRYA